MQEQSNRADQDIQNLNIKVSELEADLEQIQEEYTSLHSEKSNELEEATLALRSLISSQHINGASGLDGESLLLEMTTAISMHIEDLNRSKQALETQVMVGIFIHAFTTVLAFHLVLSFIFLWLTLCPSYRNNLTSSPS